MKMQCGQPENCIRKTMLRLPDEASVAGLKKKNSATERMPK